MSSGPRVFGVDYQFLACGDVFTQGLQQAATDLGITYQHASCRAVNIDTDIERFKPDLVFVVHGRIYTKRFPRLIQRHRSAVWLLDEPYEVDETSSWSKQYALVFANDRASLARHERATYLPVCYDPHLHHTADGPRPFAVGFIGGANPTRERYLAALARAKVLHYVIGGRWADPSVARLCVSDNVAPCDTAARYRATRIVLNVFRTQHHWNREGIVAEALNPRVYEAFACGALVVSEWRPEAETLLPEMPTFHGIDECVALVRDLLNDVERAEAIRRACVARLEAHTYQQRLATVLRRAGLLAEEVAA